MLSIVRIHKDKPTVSFPLLPGRKYTIGRKQGDITLPDDASISRTHAELIVGEGNPSENKDPVVTLSDMGSKFGTFKTAGSKSTSSSKNDTQGITREGVQLSVGDKIRFGRQWNEFELRRTPLVIVTSSFKADQNFKDVVAQLGGQIVNDWSDSVTHVVMQSLTLTVKVVCALLSGKPIVTPSYISDLMSSLILNKPPPDPNNFLPTIVEKGICNLEESTFYPNEARTSLFEGKTFLFCNTKHLKRIATAINAGGGLTKLIADAVREDVTKDQFIIMAGPGDLAGIDGGSKAIIHSYRKSGKRYIPDSEIGLAAVHNSIEKFCNPKHNLKDAVMPRLITTQTQSSISSGASVRLVPETQELSTERSSFNSQSVNVVNETVLKSDGDVEMVDLETNDEVAKCSTSSAARASQAKAEESSGRAGKKRTASGSPSKPESKRLKEVIPSTATTTDSVASTSRSPTKSNFSKTLTSVFNLSDDDDSEEEECVVVHDSQRDAGMNDISVVSDSQRPKVNIVNLKDLQTLSGTQDFGLPSTGEKGKSVNKTPLKSSKNTGRVPNPGTDDIPTVRASVMDAPTIPVEPRMTERAKSTRNVGRVPNPGTDDIPTVRASVMDAPTIPVEPRITDRAKSSKTKQENSDMEPGTSTGRKRRRDHDDEDNEDALAEKTRKINIDPDKSTRGPSENPEEPIITPPPLIRKPLFNPNLSRLESSLLGSNGSNCVGKKNFKSFQKVLPKFLDRPALSCKNVKGNDPKDSRMNISSDSIRARAISVKLIVRDYIPGLPGEVQMETSKYRDKDVQPHLFGDSDDSVFPSFDTAVRPIVPGLGLNIIVPKQNGEAKEKTSARRTSPRKKPATDSESMMPPPPPRVCQPLPAAVEAEPEHDMWSF